jgi:hypothetical protein
MWRYRDFGISLVLSWLGSALVILTSGAGVL